MSYTRKSTRPRMFHPHARVIVFNVLRFMKEEADSGTNIIALHKIEERVAMATGISRRTLSRIKKEFKNASDEPSQNNISAQHRAAMVKPKVKPPPTDIILPELIGTPDKMRSPNGSVFLPQVVMNTENSDDFDADLYMPEIVIKSEVATEEISGSMLLPDYIKTEEMNADPMYCSQNIMLPELIIKSENESDME